MGNRSPKNGITQMSTYKDDAEPVGEGRPPTDSRCSLIFSQLATSKEFNLIIFFAILLGALSVGIQTISDWSDSPVLTTISAVVLWLYVIELIIKVLALCPRVWCYLLQPWNLFDLFIVVVGLVQFFSKSIYGATVVVLRVLRLLRMLSRIKQLPSLRLVVCTMLQSLPGIGWLGLLMSMIMYIYAVIGVLVFKTNDPKHFGDLAVAFLTLFRVLTSDGWTHALNVNMRGCQHEYTTYEEAQCTHSEAFGPFAVLYFVSFLFFAGIILLNLVLGIIYCEMDTVAAAIAAEDRPAADAEDRPE